MIEEVCNVNAIDGEFGNALQAAAYKSYDNIVRYLFPSGTNIDQRQAISALPCELLYIVTLLQRFKH